MEVITTGANRFPTKFASYPFQRWNLECLGRSVSNLLARTLRRSQNGGSNCTSILVLCRPQRMIILDLTKPRIGLSNCTMVIVHTSWLLMKSPATFRYSSQNQKNIWSSSLRRFWRNLEMKMLLSSGRIKAVEWHAPPSSAQRHSFENLRSTRNHMLSNQPVPIAFCKMARWKSGIEPLHTQFESYCTVPAYPPNNGQRLSSIQPTSTIVASIQRQNPLHMKPGIDYNPTWSIWNCLDLAYV